MKEQIKIEVMKQSEQLKDRNDRLSELGTDLIREVEKKLPYIQLPNDEDLYMALHRLKQEIKFIL